VGVRVWSREKVDVVFAGELRDQPIIGQAQKRWCSSMIVRRDGDLCRLRLIVVSWYQSDF